MQSDIIGIYHCINSTMNAPHFYGNPIKLYQLASLKGFLSACYLNLYTCKEIIDIGVDTGSAVHVLKNHWIVTSFPKELHQGCF